MAEVTEKKDKEKRKKDKHSKSAGENAEKSSIPSYQPPEGFDLVEGCSDVPHFDWDTINNDPNLELWAIRLPTGLKPKYLDNMILPFPDIHSSNVGEPIARITAGKKQRQYDVTAVPQTSTNSSDIGGEEMKVMKCLLPRKAKGGKLFVAPKSITGHILFSESLSTSVSAEMHSPTTSPDSVPLPLPSSSRYSHPMHLLKHKYIPTNVEREDASGGEKMDIDSPAKMKTPKPSNLDPISLVTIDDSDSSHKRHKKRKKDGEGDRQSSKKQKHNLDTTL